MQAERMILAVEEYIRVRKGVKIKLTPKLPREYALLIKAYEIALKWIKKN